MPTFNQLTRNIRKNKKTKLNRTPALKKNPQKKGTCLRVFTMTPRKPNSALRKVTRIRLVNKKKITAYIPGEGHSLQKFADVLIRGGRTKDLPGIKYKVIRGKYDLRPVNNKIKARSKYGVRKK
mgnify:CR=1 FL=1